MMVLCRVGTQERTFEHLFGYLLCVCLDIYHAFTSIGETWHRAGAGVSSHFQSFPSIRRKKGRAFDPTFLGGAYVAWCDTGYIRELLTNL